MSLLGDRYVREQEEYGVCYNIVTYQELDYDSLKKLIHDRNPYNLQKLEVEEIQKIVDTITDCVDDGDERGKFDIERETDETERHYMDPVTWTHATIEYDCRKWETGDDKFYELMDFNIFFND